MIIAYGSLVVMALIPIFLGRSDRSMSLAKYQFLFCSFRSVDSQKEQKDNHEKTGERPETMTQKDAMMFPLIASCALFGLYVFFQVFSKEHVNLLLSVYFLVLGEEKSSTSNQGGAFNLGDL